MEGQRELQEGPGEGTIKVKESQNDVVSEPVCLEMEGQQELPSEGTATTTRSDVQMEEQLELQKEMDGAAGDVTKLVNLRKLLTLSHDTSDEYLRAELGQHARILVDYRKTNESVYMREFGCTVVRWSRSRQ